MADFGLRAKSDASQCSTIRLAPITLVYEFLNKLSKGDGITKIDFCNVAGA